MPVLREHGMPLLAHAELDLRGRGAEPAIRAPTTAICSRARRAWEDDAIRAARAAVPRAPAARCTSSTSRRRRSVAICARPSAEGLPVTVETCPHYLSFDAESIPDGATHFKCAPPIRERENREALWARAARRGHRHRRLRPPPVHARAQAPGARRLREAWGGIASLQLGLPAVWTEA